MYNNISTPNNPLHFFEIFLIKDNFEKFTNDFFTNYDNPTFHADIKNGFIEYVDNVYQEGEPLGPNVIYFKNYLLKIVEPQISNSINLIKNKTEEIVINGYNPHNYINILRKKYQVLRNALGILLKET